MRIVEDFPADEDFSLRDEAAESAVARKILREVRTRGDSAVLAYTKKYDGICPKTFEISRAQINDAYKRVKKKTALAIREAAKNIGFFAKMQLKQCPDFQIMRNGMVLGQRAIPVQRIGAYVPGGRYPLPSSALMSTIPAKIAGVKEIIVCSPKIAPETIVAADIGGADRIFCIGGIQAIGAMAYGTKSIPRVDMIVGPGNRFVAAAKREVFGAVGIDFFAGPSELLIIADSSGQPKRIACELLAQAEHDPNAKANLITTSRELAKKVDVEVRSQLATLLTKNIAELSIEKGRIIIADSLNKAVEMANRIAPEHLQVQVRKPEKIIRRLRNYGSLFTGENAPVAFGDYCSGTNHILPTNGASRYTGGLSVRNFLKIVTYQRADGKSPGPMSRKLSKIASALAEAEGLDGHKRAAQMQ